MRRFNQLIFDEVIATQAGGVDVYYYTDQNLSNPLGHNDQLGMQAIADDLTGGTTHGGTNEGGLSVMVSLEIYLETSCDGRHWVRKNSAAEIPLSWLSGTGPTLLPYGQDDGARPSYGFVRFVLRLSAQAPASVHVRLYVTGRDQGGVIHRAFQATQYQPVLPPKEKAFDQSTDDYDECLKRYTAHTCRSLFA